MKYIDIFELSRAKIEEEGRLSIEDLPDLKEMLKSEKPKADVYWKATGTGQRRRLASALLTVEAKLTTDCARCGNPLEIEINKEVPFLFTKTENEANRLPIEDDGDDEVVVGSTKFDVAHWVEEELILSLDLFPSHEDCEPDPGSLQSRDEEEIPERVNPFAGLADAIVDLVSTGATLKANNMVEIKTIAPISSRLIVNQAAMKLKREELMPIMDAMRSVAEERRRKE